MGKATIISGGPNGLYKIKYDTDRLRMEEKIARIEEIIAMIEDIDIPRLEALVAQRTIEHDARMDALQAAIDAADGDYADTREENKAALYSLSLLNSAKDKLNIKKLKILSLTKQKHFLKKYLPPDEIIDAWCADLTEDLTGEVGTIEINGECPPANMIGAGVPVIIKPGGTDGLQAVHDPDADGLMAPALGISPYEYTYALAMLPGWQKWMPTYRIGTITELNGNLCDLRLDTVYSSRGGLPVTLTGPATPLVINQRPVEENVLIKYLDCHGAAFNVGDRVVVAYTANADKTVYTPEVIGFESNPKDCGCGLYILYGGIGAIRYDKVWRVDVKDYAVTDEQAYAREHHASAIDKTNKLIYSFGGWRTPDKLDRLDSYNMITTHTTLYTPPVKPEARIHLDMVLDETGQKLYIFGGEDATGYLTPLADTWSYDIQSGSWSDITPASSPAGRHSYKMVMDQAGRNIYMFGGGKEQDDPPPLIDIKILNELWKYEIDTNTWTNITPAGGPSKRIDFAMVIFQNYIYIFGGYDGDNYLNDMWKYEIDINTFTNITPPSNNPAARRHHDMAIDPAGEKIYMFGGHLMVGDIHTFDTATATWTSTTPTPAIQTQRYHTMVMC